MSVTFDRFSGRVARVARRIHAKVWSPALHRRARPVRWGSLRRPRPVSEHYGRDRGTPVDRVYIDAFIGEHAADIRGRVLEVGSTVYATHFGTDVSRLDVVDIAVNSPDTTIVADLADAGSLPEATFDCILLPQTLQYVRDVDTALANCWQSLRPGGVLLVTVPAIAKLDHHLIDVDRWRFLPNGLAQWAGRACPDAQTEVGAEGNLVASIAFLHGVAAEELRADELAARDESYPMITWARIMKPATA
jgi:SAM-dependent methyltransferase